jgi:release factor glutamine methyltransferase
MSHISRHAVEAKMRPVSTARELLKEAEGRLKASQAIDHPHSGKEWVDAEEILAHALGQYPDPDQLVPERVAGRFRLLVGRRALGEPVGYIIGHVVFRGLILSVGPGAFIPRQSSEFTVDQALRRLRARKAPVLVDVATGVGPVPLAVAAELPKARTYGVDLAGNAVAWARGNARRLGLFNATFLRGNLFGPLPRRLQGLVDVVTAHVPYVGTKELPDLPEEIRRFEPEESLTDFSPRGDSLIRRVVEEAPLWLREGGWLLMEVSPDRSRAVKSLLVRAGFRETRSTRGGIVPEASRVVLGRT